MGKISILTQEQKTILDLIGDDKYLSSTFYFTGGTALSEYYLHHRYSDDLDFFTQKKIDQEVIFTLIKKWSKLHNFTFRSRFVEVVYRFDLTFGDETNLKIDFGHYPHPRVEKGRNIDQLQIDSLRDIATNKFITMSQRSSAKDFVDLYFLLQNKFTF